MKLRISIYKSIFLNNRTTFILMYIQMVLSVMLLYYMQNYFTSVDSELSVGKWLEDFSNLSLIIIISISYLYMFYYVISDGKTTINVLRKCGIRRRKLKCIVVECAVIIHTIAYFFATIVFIPANNKIFKIDYNFANFIKNSIVSFITLGSINAIMLAIVVDIVVRKMEKIGK